jgi:hypothetical protein
MDDKTRLTYLYVLWLKDKTFQAYKEFEATCKTQHNAHVKVPHSDCGGEYTGKEFVIYVKSNSVACSTS